MSIKVINKVSNKMSKVITEYDKQAIDFLKSTDTRRAARNPVA